MNFSRTEAWVASSARRLIVLHILTSIILLLAATQVRGLQQDCEPTVGALRIVVTDGSGMIYIPGATVVLRWTNTPSVRRPLRRDVSSDGTLFLCAPTDATEATLWAEFGDASSPESVVPLEAGGSSEIELKLRFGPLETGRIIGRIRDARTDAVVAAAHVSILGQDRTAETNRRGRFVLSAVPVGEHVLSVKHLGYGTLDHRLTVREGLTTDFEVRLVPDPFQMEPLIVTTTRLRRLEVSGFYERKYWGELVSGGTFFTADDVERRNPSLISHMVADQPGVYIGDCGIRHDQCVLLGSRLTSGFSPGGCPLTIYLDGTRLRPRPDAPDGVSIDEYVRPGEVAGIEVYGGASSVPGEFAGSDARCGVVAIWTR